MKTYQSLFNPKTNKIDFKKVDLIESLDNSPYSKHSNPNIEFEKTTELDTIREQYFRGEIFNVGDIVESNDTYLEILSRGSNYLTVTDSDGNIQRKWLVEVKMVDEETSNLLKEDFGNVTTNQVTYKGFTTKNFDISKEAIFEYTKLTQTPNIDPVALLNAIKATDQAFGIQKSIVSGSLSIDDFHTFQRAQQVAVDILKRLGVYLHHEDYLMNSYHKMELAVSDYGSQDSYSAGKIQEMTYSSSDKLKIAKIVAGTLGVDSDSSSPEELINKALKTLSKNPLKSDSLKILKNMLNTATEAGIMYDKKLMPALVKEDSSKLVSSQKVKRVTNPDQVHPNDSDEDDNGGPGDQDSDDSKNTQSDFDDESKGSHRVGSTIEPNGDKDSLRRMKIKYKLHEDSEEDDSEMSDDELDDMLNSVSDEDILSTYDDDELHVVDDEGNHVAHVKDLDGMNESYLTEVLSRMERIKAAIRFKQSQGKRMRKMKIALHTRSSPQRINHRARNAAINALKAKLARKPLSQLTVQEKERIERIVAKKKKLIDKAAMKLVPKIRKIENARLHPINRD
jgi:hypothetical protein